MANNNIFSRLGNLWSGFISLFIKDIEEKNPEIAYENSINSMTVKFKKLKQAASAVIRRRKEIRERLETAKREYLQVTVELSAALETEQADLGAMLIRKQETLEETISTLEVQDAQAEKEAEDIKASLNEVKSKINELKAEKDSMVANLKSAEARIQIQEQLDGLSVDAEVQALDAVRSNIKNKVAEAELGAELAENDIDNRLKKLRRSAGDVNAKSKFEQMLAAKKAGSGTAEPAKAEFQQTVAAEKQS